MTWAVSDEGDQILIGFGRLEIGDSRLGCGCAAASHRRFPIFDLRSSISHLVIKYPTKQSHQVNVPHLVVAADVVGLPGCSLFKDGEKSFGVVFNIEPVADVLALSIDRDGFAAQCFEEDDGNELFGKLIGAVVVRAVGDQDRQAVGIVPCTGEVIG